MISYKISQLENGKWYGEMVVNNGRKIFNVDVICPDRNVMRVNFDKGVRQLMMERIREFLRWRHLSLERADRKIYPETERYMNTLHDMCCKMSYVNMHVCISLVYQNRNALMGLKPKEENYIWNEMVELLTWAINMYTYPSDNISVDQDVVVKT
jgi:hypothetical protein